MPTPETIRAVISVTITNHLKTAVETSEILNSSLKSSTHQSYSLKSVGAPGFEPGITRSQSEHVSRYTMPRYATKV